MCEQPSQAVLVAWERTIRVQQHFNDLELRIRNNAVIVLAAFIGAVGAVVSKSDTTSATTLPSVLLLTALIAWSAFYVMDRWWYHMLLIGAVKHAELIEKRFPDMPELHLTGSIGDASPLNVFGAEIHSSTKMDLFYGTVGLGLLLGILLLLPDTTGAFASKSFVAVLIAVGVFFAGRWYGRRYPARAVTGAPVA